MSENLWKDPWLAVFLSALLPGAGQIYGGDKTKGIFYIFVSLFLLITGIICFYNFSFSDNLFLSQISGLISVMALMASFVLFVYLLFDSYKITKKYNLNYQLYSEIVLKKKPWLAVFLSDIFPGLGQFYNGQILKGILLVLVFGFLCVLIEYYFLFFVLLIPLYFIALKDAYESAENKNNSNRKFLICESKFIRIFIIIMILVNAIPVMDIMKQHFFLLKAFKLPSGSMVPTLMVGDHILVDRTEEVRNSIKREDIIVFKYPLDKEKSFIKRVVAVGGDTIESKDKNIYINGALLEEPYAQHVENNIIPGTINPRDNFGPFVVPENKFFVLGDNRDKSMDSRHWGYIPNEDILGKAFKIYWSWDSANNNVRWERIGKAIQN